jgi:hypothetical protein
MDLPPDEQVFQNFVPEVLQLIDQLKSNTYDKAAVTQQVRDCVRGQQYLNPLKAYSVRQAMGKAKDLAKSIPDQDIPVAEQMEIIATLQDVLEKKQYVTARADRYANL